MDNCWELLKKNELNDNKKRERLCKLIYKDFLKISDKKYNISIWDSYQMIILILKSRMYSSYEIDKFFNILEKYNYNMHWEIKDAIYHLSFLKNPNDNIKAINLLLNSPVIDDIRFNGKDTFEIVSDEYGKFSFHLATKYLNNNDITDYINKNGFKPICHIHTYNMSKWYPNWYTITSHLEERILGKFYHSYTYDSDRDVVIDLRSNCVMDKESYDRLYYTNCISKTLNNRIDSEAEIINQKIKLKKVTAKVLRIALYKEYLNSIGYTGSLEDAPSLRKVFVKK